jgi:hypothetical protein
MLKRKIFVFILLSSLFLSFYPAQAHIVHEDPDSLPVREPYDADQRLALSLEAMFGSLDSFMAHVNASDFPASRQDILLFSLSHANFNEVYRRASLSGSDMDAIAEKLAFMPDDLRATVNSSEAYSAALEQFSNYTAVNDLKNATQLAATLQISYRNVSESLQRFNANSLSVLKGLVNTSIDTTSLENGLAKISSYASSVNESIRKPSSLLGSASLTLAANRYQVTTGDYITLTATMAAATSSPIGHRIRFYVDGLPIGDAMTDWTGSCPLVYRVDGRSFNRTMVLSAEFIPAGESLAPAYSNVIEITRWPERAFLQAHLSPRSETYGKSVLVSGTLTTLSCMPVAFQVINISMAGAMAGNATTGLDGSYSALLAVGQDTPAGNVIILSAYDSPPWSALMSAESYPCVLTVSPLASLVTLDLPKPIYRGGETDTFQGTVTADDGTPVTAANVTVFAGDISVGTCLTNASGSYRLVAPVPYDITPGDHDLHATFDPGTGMALAGSRSAAFMTAFEPAAPRATVRGLPLLAFPGDELNLTGVLMTDDGRPLDGRQINVDAGGSAVIVTTDAGGSYQMTWKVPGGPGVYSLTVSILGDGLLSGLDYPAGLVLVMPFDRTGTALAVLVLLVAAGLAIVKMTGTGRRRKQLSLTGPSPAVPQPDRRSAAFTIEEELKIVDLALSGGSDRREAVRSIYLAAKRMLYATDLALPEAVTHRELCHLLSGRKPSISAPLGVITASYEGVIFGHRQPTDEEVYGSLHNLNELRKLLYGQGGPS